MNASLLVLVEGESDEESLPVILRRLLAGLGVFGLAVAKPWRVHRTAIARGGEIQRAVTQGVRSRQEVEAVLVVVDADDDDAGELEGLILLEARSATPLPVAAVVATRELEAWFLAAKESLRGVRRIRSDASAPPEPEAIRDAKGRLTRNMELGARYVERDDQPAFAARFDMGRAAERCRSFARLVSEVERLAKATGLLSF